MHPKFIKPAIMEAVFKAVKSLDLTQGSTIRYDVEPTVQGTGTIAVRVQVNTNPPHSRYYTVKVTENVI